MLMKNEDLTIRLYQPEENRAQDFYNIAEEAFESGAPWNLAQYETTLVRPDLFFLVALDKDELVGYIGGQALLDEAEVYTVVVKKECHKKGIATLLLKCFKEECVRRGVTNVYLEVRRSNIGAHYAYLKNGFQEIALRKNYYSYPTEDALLMKCSLRKKEEDVKEKNLSN